MKVVINVCYGGFGLSQKALERLGELQSSFVKRAIDENGNLALDMASYMDVYSHAFRTDPTIIQVVEELGQESWGNYAKLKIVTIPDDIQWEIEEYDGNEEVREVSHRWR